MKKTFEEYKKMSKLDRIEYLLLKKEKSFSSLAISIFPFFAIFLLVFASFCLLMFQMSENLYFLSSIITIFKGIKYYFLVLIIIDLFRYLVHRNKVKKIDKILFKK